MRKLAVKTRGSDIETEHFGYIALVNAAKKTDKNFNDDASFFVRSCIKPIQAKTCKDFLQDKLKDEFLTMAVASHLSTAQQLKILESMLKSFQLSENDLHCGLVSAENKQIFKTKIYHNCAGKHIAHLAASKEHGLGLNYFDETHPLQQKTREELLRLCELEDFETAIDGCGLPTAIMPLAKLALGFVNASFEDAYKEIFKTVNRFPYLISAPARFDQELMTQFPGKFFAKSGADGMMVVLNLETHECLVIKSGDGHKRVKDFIAKKTLEDLGWIKTNSLELDNNIYNSLGECVGEIRALSCLG